MCHDSEWHFHVGMVRSIRLYLRVLSILTAQLGNFHFNEIPDVSSITILSKHGYKHTTGNPDEQIRTFSFFSSHHQLSFYNRYPFITLHTAHHD